MKVSIKFSHIIGAWPNIACAWLIMFKTIPTKTAVISERFRILAEKNIVKKDGDRSELFICQVGRLLLKIVNMRATDNTFSHYGCGSQRLFNANNKLRAYTGNYKQKKGPTVGLYNVTFNLVIADLCLKKLSA